MIEYPKITPIENPKIVEKDYLIGTVYCFINKINNKIYIGETVKCNYKARFIEHQSKSKTVNNYFYKAIRKYGWENFESFVLFQTEEVLLNTPENKEILNDIVNKKEIEYIALYKSTDHQYGYNLTIGGDGVSGYTFSKETKKHLSEIRSGENHWNYGNFNNKTSKPILQFDLDGNFIKEWPSGNEINRQLHYNANNVTNCCRDKLQTYQNYIWIFKSDYENGKRPNTNTLTKQFGHGVRSKAVLQYDFLGNFIAEYKSCAEAGKALGKGTPSKAATGKEPQLHGYIWIYKDDYSDELLKDKIEKIKAKSFYHKTLVEQKLIKND